MNCYEFDLQIVALARGEITESNVGAHCWAHAAGCPRCAERLLEQKKLSAGLAALAALGEKERAPERIEVKLRREFQAQRIALETTRAGRLRISGVPSRGELSAIWRFWAMAAAVLLAVLGAIITGTLRSTPTVRPVPLVQRAADLNGSSPRNESRLGGVRRPSPSGKAANSTVATGPTWSSKPRVATRPSASRRKPGSGERSPGRSSQADPAISRQVRATSFLPLPYGSGLSLDEGWEVVRVSMPRSALASLGVPVISEQTATDTVNADVVLGQDGLARAIRFVQ